MVNPIQRVKPVRRPAPERGRGGGRSPAFSYPVLNLAGVGRFPQSVDDFEEPSPDQQAAAAAEVGMPQDLMVKSYTFERAKYGRMISINPIAQIADSIALYTPDNYRIFLWIQNTSLTATLFLNFGAPAGPGAGMVIPAGYGSVLFDEVVSQDDIHIAASSNNTQFALTYANKGAFTK